MLNTIGIGAKMSREKYLERAVNRRVFGTLGTRNSCKLKQAKRDAVDDFYRARIPSDGGTGACDTTSSISCFTSDEPT